MHGCCEPRGRSDSLVGGLSAWLEPGGQHCEWAA